MAGVFVGMDNYLVGGLENLTAGYQAQYSVWVTSLIGAWVTIQIILMGYETLAGKRTTPIEDVCWILARNAIIFTFVANLDGWLSSTLDAVNDLKNGFTGGQNIWAILDSMWAKTQTLAKTLHDLDDSTFVKDQGFTAQTSVWVGMLAVMIASVFVSGAAELTMIILSVFAPIFIGMLMFGWLKDMFTNWLKNIVQVVLTIMFAALFLRMGVDYLNKVMDAAIAGSDGVNIVSLGFQVLMVCFAVAGAIILSTMLSSRLAGASLGAALQGVATKMGMGAASKATQAVAPHAAKALGGLDQGASRGMDAVRSVTGTASSGSYSAASASKGAIRHMQALNEQRSQAANDSTSKSSSSRNNVYPFR